MDLKSFTFCQPDQPSLQDSGISISQRTGIKQHWSKSFSPLRRSSGFSADDIWGHELSAVLSVGPIQLLSAHRFAAQWVSSHRQEADNTVVLSITGYSKSCPLLFPPRLFYRTNWYKWSFLPFKTSGHTIFCYDWCLHSFHLKCLIRKFADYLSLKQPIINNNRKSTHYFNLYYVLLSLSCLRMLHR